MEDYAQELADDIENEAKREWAYSTYPSISAAIDFFSSHFDANGYARDLEAEGYHISNGKLFRPV